MASRYPIQDFFQVTTPTLSVTIRADDTPIPRDIPLQKNQANLVTVSALESKESRAPTSNPGMSSEDFGKTIPKETVESVKVEELPQDIQYMIQRADSKHAREIYGRPGAPPPVQEVIENDDDTYIKRINTYETKDYTYWDKLKRRDTTTEIRRWHTYVPEDVQDTAFFGRNFLVDVPGEAYAQGIFYSQVGERGAAREFKLETTGYVAPAQYLYVRSINERRKVDPIQKMCYNISQLACSCSCP